MLEIQTLFFEFQALFFEFPTLIFEFPTLFFEFPTLFFGFPTLFFEFQTFFFEFQRLIFEIQAIKKLECQTLFLEFQSFFLWIPFLCCHVAFWICLWVAFVARLIMSQISSFFSLVNNYAMYDLNQTYSKKLWLGDASLDLWQQFCAVTSQSKLSVKSYDLNKLHTHGSCLRIV